MLNADFPLMTQDQLHQLNELERVRVITSSGGLAHDDDILLLNSSSGVLSLTLPRARGGKRLTLTRVAGANNITLSRSGSDTINGATTMTISSSYSPVRLKAINGMGWVTV